MSGGGTEMLLRPLGAAFGLAVSCRNQAFERGWLAAASLAAPVASIGNLAVGGRGKTPAVIAIGRALQRRGLAFDVLTRGYRRRHNGLAVALTGAEPLASTGDEPLLIARALRAPVLIDGHRVRAGREGERRFHSRLHLLDDGFQHRQLRRAFDLVIVNAADLDGRLLPAGRLREPPRALARAHAVVYLAADSAEDGEMAGRTIARYTTAPVFRAWKAALPIAPPAAGAARPLRPLAFCALAQPQSFWQSLEALGLTPCARLAFRDHHRYRPADLRRLEAAAQAAHADGFITTEKDAVNLEPCPHRLAPLLVVRMELCIDRLEALVDLLLERAGLAASGADGTAAPAR